MDFMHYQRILRKRLEEKARKIVFEEGRQVGLREVRQEGELEGRRSSLVIVLQNRFKDASHEIIAQIQQIRDIDILKLLLDEASLARNWKSFEKKFSLVMAKN
ncbi:MAG: hypothetical protein LBR22_01090 [Desulfovibrio sp.]|jgi:flagellar biosynthesis/type III secretory pathway protein FliH|nr:hypothetical protein [Desulfovibrio sp.]